MGRQKNPLFKWHVIYSHTKATRTQKVPPLHRYRASNKSIWSKNRRLELAGQEEGRWRVNIQSNKLACASVNWSTRSHILFMTTRCIKLHKTSILEPGWKDCRGKTRDVTSVLVASFCYIVRVITKVPNKQLSISTMSYK